MQVAAFADCALEGNKVPLQPVFLQKTRKYGWCPMHRAVMSLPGL